MGFRISDFGLGRYRIGNIRYRMSYGPLPTGESCTDGYAYYMAMSHSLADGRCQLAARPCEQNPKCVARYLISHIRYLVIPLLAIALASSGCDAIFGSKDDGTTDEVFDEGRIDPTLVDEVGYVPLNPFYSLSTLGGFDAPTDVYVGYDELIYVADRQGLHVLDLAGRPQAYLGDLGWPNGDTQPLRDIQAIIQDRLLQLYVAARRDTVIDGRTWDLPVVYRISGLTSGTPTLEDIIWHPFDDKSRSSNQFRNPREFGERGFSDEDAAFTGVAVLASNQIYVTRSGPLNVRDDGLPTIVAPFNGVLVFTTEGVNNTFISTLSPNQASLLSAIYPSAVATFIGPPQRSSPDQTEDFFIAQAPPNESLRYNVLSVRVVETTNGTVYRVDTERLGASTNPENGDGFLYGDFRFEQPAGLAIAADETGYLFVVDAAKDSLLIFNRNGVEGVAAPPGAGNLRPVKVSFGGAGSGPLQFSNPSGVAYFERTVYVADTGNNRIARYRLNTDFE